MPHHSPLGSQPLHAGTAARLARGAAPLGAWFGLLGLVVAFRHVVPVATAALWGLLLTWSFVAWGQLLLGRLVTGLRSGWGLEGTVGVGLSLCAGGVLASAHLVSTTAICVWAIAGVALACAQRAHHAAPRRRFAWGVHGRRLVVLRIALLGLGGMVALAYIGASSNQDFNVWDDNMSYRAFARQLLDTGTLFEQFSYRRIGAYGGQSYLHAMVLALGDRDRLHLVDNGIAPLLIFGMILGYRRARWSARVGSLAALVLLVTLPYTPHNLGSAMTGVLFFFGLFRVFDDPAFERAPKARALLVGLLAAGVCTLRQNYMSAAAAYAALAYVALLLSATERRPIAIEALAAGLATLGFLAPWMLLAQMTVHTALYPVIRGNMRPDFGILGSVTFAEEMRWTWTNLFTPKPIQAIGLLFVAVFVLPPSRRSRALHALMFASIGAYLLMMHFFRTFHDADSIARYYLGFTVAFGLAATLKLIDEVGAARRGALPLAATLCGATLAMQVWNTRDTLNGLVTAQITAAEGLFRRAPAEPSSLEDLYRRIQESVPPGPGILLMLDHTYLLDGKRNTLFSYDHPGVMGPDNIPTFDGPEKWADYMLSHGVQFVAYQFGNSSVEYRRGMAEQRLGIVVPPSGRGGFYKIQARFELTAFDDIETLAKSRVNVFSEGEFHVIDLKRRR